MRLGVTNAVPKFLLMGMHGTEYRSTDDESYSQTNGVWRAANQEEEKIWAFLVLQGYLDTFPLSE